VGLGGEELRERGGGEGDGWLGGWMDGWLDGWMDGLVARRLDPHGLRMVTNEITKIYTIHSNFQEDAAPSVVEKDPTSSFCAVC